MTLALACGLAGCLLCSCGRSGENEGQFAFPNKENQYPERGIAVILGINAEAKSEQEQELFRYYNTVDFLGEEHVPVKSSDPSIKSGLLWRFKVSGLKNEFNFPTQEGQYPEKGIAVTSEYSAESKDAHERELRKYYSNVEFVSEKRVLLDSSSDNNPQFGRVQRFKVWGSKMKAEEKLRAEGDSAKVLSGRSSLRAFRGLRLVL